MKMIKLIPLMLLSSMLLINCGGDGKNGAVSNDNLLSEDYIFIEPVVPPVPTPPTPTPPGPTPPDPTPPTPTPPGPTPPTPSINTAPVADAGNKQDVKLNTLVTLNGSGSYDVDGDPLTYKWVMVDKPTGSSATLSSASSITPTFTADKDGHYRVKLRVHDGKVNSPADTVYITVNTPLPSNTAPTAVAKGTSHVVVVRGEDHEVLLDGTDSYDDGIVVPLTYKWTSGPYVVNKSTVHAKPTCADNWTVCYNADQRPICSYNVKLSVYDGEFTDTDTFNLTVDYSACEHDPVKPISSIHLDPAYQQSIPVTKHKTYKLWVYYKDNTTKDVTTDAKLSTSQSSIATIDAHGKVTGNTVGDVLIKASYKGFTDTAPLTVTN